jgi:hypothetical protein
MARIDLKNAIIRILDGYTAAAAVNNGPGYAAGDVTMAINTVTGDASASNLPVGVAFFVVGCPLVHVVTARSGGPPNTSITFTPALSDTVADDAVITFIGNSLEVNIGAGNLTYNEKVDRIYELDRGRLDTVKNGDEQPVEVSMDFVWDFITAVTGSGTPTIEDALKNRGEASTWVSSDTADPCAPYAVDIMVEYVPPCGDVPTEVITLPVFRYESLDHNSKDAQVSCQGKCNVVEAAVSRSA